MDTLHFEDVHHTQFQEEEEEDILSLSDLPLYSDDQSDEWEQDLSTQGSTSFSSSEDDYFEFFSQEYLCPLPTDGIPPEDIIFCGKLIPYRQPSYCDAKTLFETRKQEIHAEKKQNCGVLRWNIGSSKSTFERCIESKNCKKSEISSNHVERTEKDRNASWKKVKGCDVQVQKLPVMASTSSSSGKAKWSLFLFGTSSFPSAMDVPKGIQSRRSRRQYPPPAFRFRSEDKIISADREREWRVWGLIGALSCGGHRQPDAMMAASIGRSALK